VIFERHIPHPPGSTRPNGYEMLRKDLIFGGFRSSLEPGPRERADSPAFHDFYPPPGRRPEMLFERSMACSVL
jgi:hypothetical protein